MKATIFYDIKFIEQNGLIYSSFGLTDDIFKRYLKIFEDITVVSRKDSIAINNTNNMNKQFLVSNIKLFPFNHNYSNIFKVVHKAVSDADFCIIRLPSFAGVISHEYCERNKKPYAVEVVGCALDALWYHSLRGKILSIPFDLLIKRAIKKSRIVAYITKSYLQSKYPTTGRQYDGISNVSLKEAKKDTLERRIYKISNKKEMDIVHIGLIGSLDIGYKGHDTAIKALMLVKRIYPFIKMHFLGYGNRKRWIKYSTKFRVEQNIEYHGPKPGGEPILNWLDGIDIYIQPSLTEGHGRAIVEAMSRACVVYATNVGGISDSLNYKYLFKKHDYKALSKLILKSIFDKSYSIEAAKENYAKSFEYCESIIEKLRMDFYYDAINLWSLPNK